MSVLLRDLGPAKNGTRGYCLPGDQVVSKGVPVDMLYIILEGRVSHLADVGGVLRKVMDWRAG